MMSRTITQERTYDSDLENTFKIYDDYPCAVALVVTSSSAGAVREQLRFAQALSLNTRIPGKDVELEHKVKRETQVTVPTLIANQGTICETGEEVRETRRKNEAEIEKEIGKNRGENHRTSGRKSLISGRKSGKSGRKRNESGKLVRKWREREPAGSQGVALGVSMTQSRTKEGR
ncbi:uncharacterized protein LOC125034047 [Penaeus chinensis]|uniref:uncharacterized protein LOC125034047 n=1 Tax=Penaeus chinensis TaxID=139456 RepID=UPI001FB78680|nr:uncharacterized protein LOC125034047 [Penaeus chinensis]